MHNNLDDTVFIRSLLSDESKLIVNSFYFKFVKSTQDKTRIKI